MRESLSVNRVFENAQPGRGKGLGRGRSIAKGRGKSKDAGKGEPPQNAFGGKKGAL